MLKYYHIYMHNRDIFISIYKPVKMEAMFMQEILKSIKYFTDL